MTSPTATAQVNSITGYLRREAEFLTNGMNIAGDYGMVIKKTG